MDCTNSDLIYIGFVSVMLEFDYFHYCLFTPGLAHINPEAIRDSQFLIVTYSLQLLHNCSLYYNYTYLIHTYCTYIPTYIRMCIHMYVHTHIHTYVYTLYSSLHDIWHHQAIPSWWYSRTMILQIEIMNKHLVAIAVCLHEKCSTLKLATAIKLRFTNTH